MIDKSIWTSGGFAERVMEADARLKSSPALLTDGDIEALDKYYGGADTFRRKREEARAQKEQQQRAAFARSVSEESTAWRKGESIEEWAARVPKAPVPAAMLRGLIKFLIDTFKEQKNVFEEFRQENLALRNEINSIEKGASGRGVTGVRWAGTHEVGREYRSGELVTRGGLWLCKSEKTTTQPGSDPTQWTLIVHRAKLKGDER